MELDWHLQHDRPPGWHRHLVTCGGTYFHSPAFLEADRELDRPLYGAVRAGGDVVGVTVVCPRRCRLGLRPRHGSAPSLPALREDRELDAAEVALSLADRLEERGMVELDVSSYGAPADTRLPAGWSAGKERIEYRVPLEGGEEGIRERMSSHHRRYVRQGSNADYRLRLLDGPEALEALRRVLSQAAARSREDGDGFAPPSLPDPDVLGTPSSDGWGGTAYAAFGGDGLLSAAYVGWAGRKAYYVSGGSTQAGYDGKAAFWMHPAIMADLFDRGLREYNLGGTPAGARDQGHPQHGLFRFKSGFGPERVVCRGGVFRSAGLHLALHRAADRVSSLLSGGGGEGAGDE